MPNRARPDADALYAPFWHCVNEGVLRVQTCSSCGKYQHPPKHRCGNCGSEALGMRKVSGDAQLVSWTLVFQKLTKGFESATPYYILLVELVEQAGLFFVSDHPGDDSTPLHFLKQGTPMRLECLQVDGDFCLPQFRFITESQR